MCFSVLSRHRVQILMLVFMLFHCSDFAQKPKSSTTLHVSFDAARLLQTQRAGSLQHSRRRRQLASLYAQHRTPSHATSVRRASRVVHFRVQAASSISKPSLALVHLLGQAVFRTLGELSFVCQSYLAFPWRCRGPTELEACGVLPRSQCVYRSHISGPAVL